ncbi:hypothetical protein ACXZ9C_11230 [Streptococcus agalactiae]
MAFIVTSWLRSYQRNWYHRVASQSLVVRRASGLFVVVACRSR